MSDLAPAGASPSPAGRAARWLAPDARHLRSLLALPELALVAESCTAERRLHEALQADPHRPVEPGWLAAVADDDARSSYETFLRFREALFAAGSFEAYYLALMRSGRIAVPPVFIATVVEAIVAHLLEGCADAFERRAAQLLYRPQRVSISSGRVLAADADAADRKTPGADIVARLLRESHDGMDGSLPVLGTDNAGVFAAQGDPPSFILDLTHEITNEIGHGLRFTTRRADSGLAALARVLERWVAHFLGVRTTIRPLQRIDDPAWAWHIGLDAEASSILDDLYRGLAPDPGRMERLIGLFRLDFEEPAEMRADLAGRPVYLGLAITAAQTLKLKPQNLLLNLPLAAAM
jgi:hypothetical protein